MKEKPYVICFSNIKGGVGKTTCTINVAYSLPFVDEGAKVLVIDSDPQGNASGSVIYDEEEYEDCSLFELYKMMMDGGMPSAMEVAKHIYRPSRPVIKTDESTGRKFSAMEPFGFDILPSNISMQIIEMQGTERKQGARIGTAKERILRDLVGIIKKYFDYDYILIDCPPNFGMFLMNAMEASDYIAIPIGSGLFSIKGVGYTLDAVDVMKKLRLHGLTNLGLINTLYKKGGLATGYTDERILIEHPETEMFLTNVPYSVKAENSLITGNLASEDNPNIGEAYKKIAIELVWKIEHEEEMDAERIKRIDISDRMYQLEEDVSELSDQAAGETDRKKKAEINKRMKCSRREHEELKKEMKRIEENRRTVMFGKEVAENEQA